MYGYGCLLPISLKKSVIFPTFTQDRVLWVSISEYTMYSEGTLAQKLKWDSQTEISYMDKGIWQ